MATFLQDLAARLEWGIARLEQPGGSAAQGDDELAFLQRPTYLTPEVFWTFVCFVRYIALQEWVAGVIRDRLSPKESDDEEIEPEGIVPGMPDWEYGFHGRGCRLTHRFNGTVIDRDEHSDEREYVDVYFLIEYLRSLREPQLPEAKLIGLVEDTNVLWVLFRNLASRDLAQPMPWSNAYRLGTDAEDENADSDSDELAALVRRFVELCEKTPPEATRIIGMVAADWDLVASQLPDLVRNDGAWREALNARRHDAAALRWDLHHEAWSSERCVSALQQLLRLDPARAAALIASELEQPELEQVAQIARVVNQRDLREHCPALLGLLERLMIGPSLPFSAEDEESNPRRVIEHESLRPPRQPFPRSFYTDPAVENIVALLLRSNFQKAHVLELITAEGATASGELALLVLEHAPELARGLFRQAIRHGTPGGRCKAAAVLGILDEPWSREELLDALNGSRDRIETAEVRAALSHSTDKVALAALNEWEKKHPRKSSTRRSFIDAVSDVDGRLVYEMQLLHDRVLPLRNRAR